jgi:transposase
LWALLEPLLPTKQRRFRYAGRRPLEDRRVLGGILFVLSTGIAWEHLPRGLGFGSGMTCWRRLRGWQGAGVWSRLHELLLSRLRAAGEIDRSRAVIDSSHVRALEGGLQTGAGPVDRGRTGAKHQLLTDAGGIPLAVALTGGNRHDVTQPAALLDAVAPLRGRVGRPRRRPEAIVGDRGYDDPNHRRAVRERGIQPRIARKQSEHGSGRGRERWVVERTLGWLHQHRRVRIRWQRRADIHEAFLSLACALICFRPTSLIVLGALSA